MQKSPKKVISRRERPAKKALSLDSILITGLKLIKRDGLEGLSLRKVAVALDTGPASLYVYVKNLEELHSLMLDRALGKVVIPSDKDGDWRQQLSIILRSYFNVLFSVPGLGQLAMNTLASGPNTLRLTEKMLELLLAGGLDPNKAVWAVDTLPLHFAAIAAEQDVRRRQTNPLDSARQAFADINESEFPHLYKLRERFFMDDGPSRVEWALEVLLNGIFEHED